MASEAHHPDLRAGNFCSGGEIPDYTEILNCMHCGLCLPTCPTYELTGRERSSPRGRISLVKGVADGRLEVSLTFAKEMYFCLGCLACQTACPAGVPYHRLLEVARAQIAEQQPGSVFTRLGRRLAFLTFEHVALLRLAGWFIRAYQRSGLQDLVRRSRLLKLLPGRLHDLEGLLPPLADHCSSATVAELTSAVGQRRATVGMLLGCVMDVMCAAENEATVRVLTRNHCDVFSPKDLDCCGALHAHAGDMTRARELAQRIIMRFEEHGVDAVVLNSAGCGAAMKDYGHWLADDPEWADRAAAFSAKVYDLTEWLATYGLEREGLRPLDLKVTYHEACHLHHAQGVAQPPRDVIKELPGIEFIELPESTWCCGSAGVYNITHLPESLQLLDRKMGHVAETGAEVVITGNPGCLLQLQYGVRRNHVDAQAIHTVTLLDWAYGGPGSPNPDEPAAEPDLGPE